MKNIAVWLVRHNLRYIKSELCSHASFLSKSTHHEAGFYDKCFVRSLLPVMSHQCLKWKQM